MRTLKLQTGLTLVELMVAMVIGLLLLAGISQVFISNKQTYRLLEAQSHAQENGRFAFEFMAKDIRMADFWGCQIDSTNIIDRLSVKILPTSGVLKGIEGTNNTGLNGSDTITLRGTFDTGVFIESITTPPAITNDLLVSSSSSLQQGDIVLLTDCQKGDLFAVTSNTTSGGFDNIGHTTGNNGGYAENASAQLEKIYGRDAALYQFGVITYALGTGLNGEPSLFKTSNGGTRELVTGVENMQIQYGIDNGADGNVDAYIDAPTGTAWDNVVAVRVTLTTRSSEQNVIVDASGSSADNRLRRSFTSTMAVRNRLN